jgi:hypothetical protein
MVFWASKLKLMASACVADRKNGTVIHHHWNNRGIRIGIGIGIGIGRPSQHPHAFSVGLYAQVVQVQHQCI